MNNVGGTAPHGAEQHGTVDHLVKMANDIGHYFRSEPRAEDAIAGITNHIVKYWTKRMREKLAAYLRREGYASLDELPREALRRLFAEPQGGAPTAH